MNKTNVARRTFQKVWRDSRPVGSFEAHLWRPTDSRQMRQALRAAERFDRAHKAKGRRNGPLGHVGLEVYRALWARVRFSDGCLCPSIEWIMRICRRSKGAVVGALKRLKAAGFLTWIRRLEAVDGPPGVRGPQVRQATNAYALGLPGAALKLLASYIPVPLDELDRRRERDRFIAECERQAVAFSPLAEALAKLERGLGMNASPPGAMNPPLGVISSPRRGPVAR
jgi:hypothetical protein